MKITNEVVKNSFLCKFKVKYLWDKEISKNSIQKQITYLNQRLYQKFISKEKIHVKKIDLTENGLPLNLIGYYQIFYKNEQFNFHYPLVEFFLKNSNQQQIRIYFFIAKNKILKEETEYSKEISKNLIHKLNIKKATCSIVFDHDLKIKNISLLAAKNEQDIFVRIDKIINDPDNLPTRLTHCSICEVNEICKDRLIKEDSLKLLGRISDKIVSKYNTKGIFTIHQLSYTFKPRRKKRKTDTKGRYLLELKALSLKEKKTHVLNRRTLPITKNEIYIDFEGNLNHEVYLIGVVLKKHEENSKYIFWSDYANQSKIFTDLFDLLFDFEEDFLLFHYGSYELKAIKKINKKFSIISQEKLKYLEQRMINLLDYFYSDVFPPTYSNGLKEIANYLGFTWSKKDVNGLQAIYWRYDWVEHQREKIKKKIITYNIEDCLALIHVKDWLDKVFQETENLTNVILDTRRHLKSKSSLKYGNPNFLIEEYNEINKLAYFNYQREKVIIRDKKFKKEYSPKNLVPKSVNKINSNEYPPSPEFCQRCGSYKLNVHQNHPRIIIDIKINPTGIKKNNILFHGQRFRCEECGYVFRPIEYVRRLKYGYSLRIWIINQQISYRMSYGAIKKMLLEYFQVNISITSMTNIRSEFASTYSSLIEEFRQVLRNGNLIQGDETKINLRTESGYIWVLINLNTVLYYYQPNREGTFLHDFLSDFNGVIVSDFYAVYDSINCPQQKCLIHLIRDINDDLFQNQMSEDMQSIADKFGELIKKIISTIDKYGLKKRNLKKHKADVDKFYKYVENKNFKTEIGIKWQNRILKNRGKLFTFLHYDGVPWNNNNAEHAVKSFALHRREINGIYSRKGMEEFLILLSISETCKFRGISFWEFLKSKRQNLKK